MTLYPVEACPLQLDTSHSVALTASTAQIAWGGFPQWCRGRRGDRRGTFVQGCVLGQASWRRESQGSFSILVSNYSIQKHDSRCSRHQESPTPDAFSFVHLLSRVLILDWVVIHFVKIYPSMPPGLIGMYICVLYILEHTVQELCMSTEFFDHPRCLVAAFWSCFLFMSLILRDYLCRVIRGACSCECCMGCLSTRTFPPPCSPCLMHVSLNADSDPPWKPFHVLSFPIPTGLCSCGLWFESLGIWCPNSWVSNGNGSW